MINEVWLVVLQLCEGFEGCEVVAACEDLSTARAVRDRFAELNPCDADRYSVEGVTLVGSPSEVTSEVQFTVLIDNAGSEICRWSNANGKPLREDTVVEEKGTMVVCTSTLGYRHALKAARDHFARKQKKS